MHQINILIAEDEERLRKIVVKYLASEGFRVLEAEDGVKALEIFNSYDIDLLILDVMMPKLDGWNVLKKVREDSAVPVIMLTARDSEEDTLFGFRLGTDDYVTKPFRTGELVARVKALLNRAGKLNREEIIVSGGIAVNPLARLVSVGGTEVELTPKEYDLLLYFLNNQKQALSRDQILNRIWGYAYDGEDRTVDTVVKRLRQKLGSEGERIKTIRGMGYRLD
ncbi:DNA-binding response regulator [Lachnospiraceae bacterium oral taxon 500]|nr:DNA-binding response regulator [Lachnospiraceae bacterium oral taxon 500]